MEVTALPVAGNKNTPVHKASIYNSTISLGGRLGFLYNALSDRFLVFDKQKEYPLGILQDPRLTEKLKDSGFLVGQSVDEYETALSVLAQAGESQDSFHLIINPTLQCNFNCWYCYEHHHPSMMEPQTISSVCCFITLLCSKIRHLTISFFGGEPLLGFKQVIKPILEFASVECKSKGVGLEANATTNGYLFSSSNIGWLKSHGFTHAQITIDGNKSLHDKTRHLPDGSGTFEKIIANIRLLALEGIGIILRFNYTGANIESFKDIATELKDLPDIAKSKIRISMHRVWQEADISPRILENVSQTFHRVGLQASPMLFGQVCYGDKRNSVVVNYNGDLFKCTAADFSIDPRDGFLSEDGIPIWENDSLEKRMANKFSNPHCRDCRVFPICHGGCSTRPLTYPDGYCLLDFNEDKKDEIILHKFLANLRQRQDWQKHIHATTL